MRSDYDRLERHDEWPSFDDVRPRFPDGDPLTPLLDEAHPTSRTRIILALVFILGALLVKACMPGYVDGGDESAAALVD